jgi:hypothetical protein
MQSTLNLLSNLAGAEVAVFDDRAVNKEPFLTDEKGRRAGVCSTLDLLEELVAQGSRLVAIRLRSSRLGGQPSADIYRCTGLRPPAVKAKASAARAAPLIAYPRSLARTQSGCDDRIRKEEWKALSSSSGYTREVEDGIHILFHKGLAVCVDWTIQ